MGKGEIARYEQFLLFPQCFQKACFPGASKGVIVREWVNPSHLDKNYNATLLQVYRDLLLPLGTPQGFFLTLSQTTKF